MEVPVSSVVSARARTAVVAASRPLVRAGLESVATARDVRVLATTEPCTLVDVVSEHAPDIVVVALTDHDQDHDPYTEIAELVRSHPACRVLALTEAVSVVELREAIVAGVQSLVLADVDTSELQDAMLATADGTRVLAPEVAVQLAGSWAADQSSAETLLTARELQVLQHIAEGMTNAEVAAHLDLSPRTVKTHVQNLLTKLDSADRTGAVAQGFRRGLLS